MLTADDNGARWFALRVKPRHEKCVASVLRNKGYTCFLPLYKRSRGRPYSYRYFALPLFPGYLFCRFNADLRLPILMTPSVIQVVGSGKTPVPIEDHEIDAVSTIVASGLAAEPWSYLRTGQTVTLAAGPLRGVAGVLLDFRPRARLVVSIELLQRSVAVEIDREWVSPLPTACPPSTSDLRASTPRIA